MLRDRSTGQVAPTGSEWLLSVAVHARAGLSIDLG
jgi:hypothetical protein